MHHALTRVLEPVFEPAFSPHSFACRKGKGTHAALLVAREAARNHPWVLACGVRKYFPSIDHAILQDLLARRVKCKPTLALAFTIIDASNPQEEVIEYFPGDDLFTPYGRRSGLPLGNQTSQFFANVYLDPLDQLIDRQLRPGAYVRYVDDLLLFANSRAALRDMLLRIREQSDRLRLTLHPRKSRIYSTAEGFGFLGWRIFPTHMWLDRGNVLRFIRRIHEMEEGYASGELEAEDVKMRVRAWIAHAEHGNTRRLRELLFPQFRFRRSAREPEQ